MISPWAFGFLRRSLRFGRTDSDHKVAARCVAGVGHIVQIASAADADVASYHSSGDAVGGQLADAFADEPDFIVEMVSDGFVGCAGFLVGFVHFDLDVTGFEHSGEVAVSSATA